MQDDARFTGFEVEGEVDVAEGDPGAGSPHVSLEFMADYVRARLTGTGEGIPRIPAMTLGTGANYRQGPLVMRVSARRTMEQADTAPFETTTAGFTMVDASVSYRLIVGRLFHDITLVATNLTNSEARLHTSFLKSVAPLPGRELRLVYRLNF